MPAGHREPAVQDDEHLRTAGLALGEQLPVHVDRCEPEGRQQRRHVLAVKTVQQRSRTQHVQVLVAAGAPGRPAAVGRTVEAGPGPPTVHEVDRPIPGLLGRTRNGSWRPVAAVSVHGVGRVVGVYLAGAGGLAMRPVQSAVAVAGQGLVGDRYQTGTGQWCYDRRLYDDVTLIAAEALDAAGAEHGVHLHAGAARRNVETRGVDLQALVGRRFRIGEVVLRGNRACEPCRYLDRVTGQPAKTALAGWGGLRATVITGGALRGGDRVLPQLATCSVGPDASARGG